MRDLKPLYCMKAANGKWSGRDSSVESASGLGRATSGGSVVKTSVDKPRSDKPIAR